MPAFQYAPYDNSRFGATIAELLAHQGDIRARQALTLGEIQARATEQSGNAWGSALGNIGQTIAAIPQQIQQAKQQQQQQEVVGLTLQQKRREVETAARVDETKQRISALMQDATVFNPDGTLNTKSILASLQQMPEGAMGPTRPVDVGTVMGLVDPINESLTAARKAKADWEDRRTNALARMAQAIKTLGAPTPDQPQGTYLQHAQIGIASALKSGIFTPDEAMQVITAMHAQPELMPQMLDQMIAASTLPPIKLSKDEQLRSPINPSQVIASNVVPEKPTEASLAERAAGGDPQATAALGLLKTPPSMQSENVLLDGKPAKVTFNPKTGKYQDASGSDVTARVKPIPSQAAINIQQGVTDASSIADAIEQGLQPPDVKGLYRLAGPVRAELAKRGYDLTKANLDWQATQKHVATMNGAKFTALRSSIDTASDSLDVIQQLADKWNGGRFPLLNKANLALAKNGAFGKDAASIATQLDGQITDVTSELGQVYMGGNSPTDHALGLAEKNLKGEWDRKVLTDMIELARTNLRIRKNSITHSTPAGLSTSPAPAAQKKNPFRP